MDGKTAAALCPLQTPALLGRRASPTPPSLSSSQRRTFSGSRGSSLVAEVDQSFLGPGSLRPAGPQPGWEKPRGAGR